MTWGAFADFCGKENVYQVKGGETRYYTLRANMRGLVGGKGGKCNRQWGLNTGVEGNAKKARSSEMPPPREAERGRKREEMELI